MAEAAAALALARATVATQCDSLVNRSTFFATFDETKGSVDYRRWRRDLEALLTTAGTGFVETLRFVGATAAATTMTDAQLQADDITGHRPMTMPQMRQQAILFVMRQTLSPTGDAIKLIRDCVHAGGVILVNHFNEDQAIRLLDTRYQSAAVPDFDVGEEAQALMKVEWPSVLSVDEFNAHFNRAVTRATRSGLNPNDDGQHSITLRLTWWHVIASPPFGTVYFAAAQEARAVTSQACTTVAHRAAWQTAMTAAVGQMVKAGAGGPLGGLSRGVGSARYGGATYPPGLVGASPAHVVEVSAASPDTRLVPFSGGGGGRAQKACGRCALVNGKPVLHDVKFRCTAQVQCTTCMSDVHAAHSCWVEFGVPPSAKITVELSTEMTRLHKIFLAGKFDWRTTPTTLRWLNAKRGTPLGSQVAGSSAEVGVVDDLEEEMLYIGSCGYDPLPFVAPSVAPVPLPTSAPVVSGNVAQAGSGVSDVYASLVAFDGVVGGSAGQVLAMTSCGTACDDQCSGAHAPAMPPPRRFATPPAPFVPPTSSPQFPEGESPAARPGMVSPAVVGDGAGGVLALPCIMRVLMWGLLVMMMVVPMWTWLVRTDHVLMDSAYAALVAFSPRMAAILVLVWGVVVQLHGAMAAAVPASVAAVGLVGLFAGDRALAVATSILRSEVGAAVASVQAAARAVLRVPRRGPWLVLAMLGMYVHVTSSAELTSSPSLSVRPAGMPSVVNCSYTVGALTGGVSVVAYDAALDGAGGGRDSLWANRLPFGTWVVDSGADLMIAGKFIYPYATLLLHKPDVRIKGVDGALTPVDNLVRTMVRLPDGDHCVREVLVCDDFEIALWSTEYMSAFGFAALLMPVGEASTVRTPGGCDCPLQHRPYRLMAPCRVPTPYEFSSPPVAPVLALPSPSGGPAHALQLEGISSASPSWVVIDHVECAMGEVYCWSEYVDVAVSAASRHGDSSAAKEPLRLVTVEEAWVLHGAFMHAGWRTISETCRVRIPTMPRCPVCEVTKSKRLPQPGHAIQSTRPGQLTHSDTWGPFCTALYWTGCRYIVAFVDDYSRVKLPVFCKDRTTATLLSAYKVYHAWMASMGVDVNGTWLSDGGPEYSEIGMCRYRSSAYGVEG